jgi:hypothetical protein
MPRVLSTLPADIYNLLDRGVKFTPTLDNINKMTTALAGHLTSALDIRDKPRELGRMWFSDLGEKCDRKIWFKWHAPTMEALPGHTQFKFLYGNILEEQVLFLAREAGHTVEREQERVEYKHHNGWTISGRIDAVIDGVLIDVKSTSSFGYRKFTTSGVTPDTDSFGYASQISGYNVFMGESYECGFIFIDKQNGHIGLVPIHPFPRERILADIDRVGIVTEELSATYVPRGYTPEPEGKSGNEKLGVACSYCAYKRECWPGLKGYAYSSGPVFLTKVVRPPNVQEIF